MKKDKLNYIQPLIRRWLFKAVFVLSVFAFSGFNPQVPAATNVVVKTELAETSIRKPAYELKKISKILFATRPSDDSRFNIWTLRIHHNLIKSKFQSYRNRMLLCSIPSIELPIKIPSASPKDEMLRSVA